MTTTKIFMFLFIVAVSSSTVLAQESTEPARRPGGPPHAPPSQASPGMFDQFPLKPPSFDLQALWPHFAASGHGPRPNSSIEDSEEGGPRGKRSVINCNYATQGGFRCTGCRQVRRCYPFNRGTLTTCGGILPYCNNGLCSAVRGSLCYATTSTTTVASTTAANSTTTNSTATNSTNSG